MPKKVIKKTVKKRGKVLRVKKSKKTQRGGQPVTVPQGSTSGDFDSLVNDIDGLIGSIFNTIYTAGKTVVNVIELPWAVKDAYSDPTAAELGIRY